MDLQTKLKILSAAAKYDVSCSSSGSNRKNTKDGIGNGHASGICHSWSDDGRCISLLKVLFTNSCIYDCSYCINRSSNDMPKASFTPDELADLTIGFYRRNYIEGLFLSSAVLKNPDHTMELLLRTVKKLRVEYRFNGYIHLKAIPGTDFKLVSEVGSYVDRMSVNIELPTSQGLKLLAPQKNRDAIIKPMGFISNRIIETKENRRVFKKTSSFVPAGQSTQLIVGATDDKDLSIVRLSENLYKKFSLKRVYYSAYVPVNTGPRLPTEVNPPLLREHRIYQADWLLRFYGFKADELLDDSNPDLSLDVDPKADWALRNINMFPIEVNRADYEMLLRVPGIGVRSALRIVSARRASCLTYDNLKKIGVVLKRAKYFITCHGKFYGEAGMSSFLLRSLLSAGEKKLQDPKEHWEQLSIFPPDRKALPSPEDAYKSLTGDL